MSNEYGIDGTQAKPRTEKQAMEDGDCAFCGDPIALTDVAIDYSGRCEHCRTDPARVKRWEELKHD